VGVLHYKENTQYRKEREKEGERALYPQKMSSCNSQVSEYENNSLPL
jgi:hypothetical protein